MDTGRLDLGGLRHELAALLAFRWHLAGRRAQRVVPLVVAVAIGLGVGIPLTVATVVPFSTARYETVVILLPLGWAFFFVSVLISAIGAAGGRELLPRSEAVAFPVSPATDHAGALLLIPLNLAWTLQALSLVTATAYITATAPPATAIQALAVTVLWIVSATCLAQFAGWLAELARSYRYGEAALRAGFAALGVLTVFIIVTGRTREVVDPPPTTPFVIAAIGDDVGAALGASLGLVLVAVASFVGAIPVVAAIARRPAVLVAAMETRHRPRSRDDVSDLSWLSRLDRRMVLRTAPLRRGLTVLTVLPLAAAALVQVPWTGITVLPALVASAAGLLFGVNAFALDGRGALWRDSLPQPPSLWLDARIIVLIQVCAACVIVVVSVAVARSGTLPTAAEAVAVLCAAMVAVVQVASRCARWSVHRPFAAQLRRDRDAPAPPVALARYSVTLAWSTTLSGIAFSIAGSFDNVLVPLAVFVPFVASAGWSLRRSATAFEALSVRSNVTSTVAQA